MAPVNKLDSSVTGLRIAREASYGVLPGSPVWYPLEPNSYGDFGGNVTTTARETINDARSRQRGVTTDVQSSANFESDLTSDSLAELLEGVFYAAYDKKSERFNNHSADSSITDVAASTDTYTVASGTAFRSGDLVFASGFAQSANNGLKQATAGSSATSLVVVDALSDEAAPGGLAKLVVVGFEFSSGDAVIDVSGALPALDTVSKDLTELGIRPGEWVYIGGDASDEKFYNAANNGWVRVRSVTTNTMLFDKSSSTMVTDDGTDNGSGGTGQTIRIFFGRTVQNKVGSDISRTTYQLERTLGAPDDASPSQIQSEYVVGAVLNEFSISLPTSDKVTTECTFVGKDHETRTGATGVKSGTRPVLVSGEAFNSSSHVTRIRMSPVSQTNAYPTALFTFVMDGSVSINNNAERNQAVGTLGAFDCSAGTFDVSAEVTAYFTNVSAMNSIRNNDDVTLDFTFVRDNKGLVFDIPLLTLSNGMANVELNQPVRLPLAIEAAQATKVASTYTHTAMACVFDYLPDAAE